MTASAACVVPAGVHLGRLRFTPRRQDAKISRKGGTRKEYNVGRCLRPRRATGELQPSGRWYHLSALPGTVCPKPSADREQAGTETLPYVIFLPCPHLAA